MTMSIPGLLVSLSARKIDGKNKFNTYSLGLSIFGCILLVAFIMTTLFVKIGVLGLF